MNQNKEELSLKELYNICLYCSQAEGNITFVFHSPGFEKVPPLEESLIKLAEPMFDGCLNIITTLMGTTGEEDVPRSVRLLACPLFF